MKVVKSSKAPLLFYVLVFLAALSLLGAWFFLHPNSPWHSRNYYYVAFEEIGNLKINNDVNVNGIKKGHVVGFELTDSCVWAKIAVLANVKIPVDSKLSVANAGLMGERVIEISLGDSKNHYANGSGIRGDFDMGSTSIGNIVVDIVKEANYIANVLKDVADSLFSEEKKKDYSRIGEKANKLGKNVSRVVGTAGNSLDISLDSLTIAKNKFVEILDSISPRFDKMGESVDLIKRDFASLEKSLEYLKISITAVIEKLESSENAIEMQKIAEDADKLMEQIKKRGLDLNVDIF
jgi:phospholipid/cholesterol/gamma-HCH transport system substrate-binding protein